MRNLRIHAELDEVDRKLLDALQGHARLSFAELGRRVGLSPPAAAERVRKLEEAGVIKAYRAEIDPHAVGLPVTAFIRLGTPPDRYTRVIELAHQLPEVLECHHLAGGDAFVFKVVVPSVAQLEALISQLSRYGQTTTSIVLSSPVTKSVAIDSLMQEPTR
jgi:Lrp/AsnC family leucine-responsive transcriptional regulator